MRTEQQRTGGTCGYAMAALLVGLAVMSVALSVALPVWRTFVVRENEEELVFRGRQYVRAIELYQRKFANAYPPSLDVLVEQRFLRRKYRDPMVEDGEFQLLYQVMAAVGRGSGAGTGQGRAGRQGQGAAALVEPPVFGSPLSGAGSQTAAGPRGGIVGVVSKSPKQSIRVYNGRTHYNEWQFIYTQSDAAAAAGQRGGRPGQRGGRSEQQGPDATGRSTQSRGRGSSSRSR
ncbi:MAG: hypothetical protein AB1806_04875 [Acidobacteriota bacterium]